MFPLLSVTLAVSTVALSIVLYHRHKFSRLPHLIDGGDVIKALRKATSEKRGSWEVFDALAKVHGSCSVAMLLYLGCSLTFHL